MPLTEDQKVQLRAPLSHDVVKTREQGSSKLSYVEAWYTVDRCNQIFGFDGWSSETVEATCVVERERPIGKTQRPGWGVTYIAKVRVTVAGVVRDGRGAGHGYDVDLGLAHESALKEAESDGRKRALMTFGYQFGLALYDKERAHVTSEADEADAARQKYVEQCKAKIAAFAEGDTAVLHWWASDQEWKARRDFALAPAEVAELKALVKARAKL